MKKQTLWGIALPLMLNMLISQIQMVIDRSFLGQIQVEYMSALGNVTAPLWTTISVIWALSSGGTILMSQALGAGKRDRAEEVAESSLKYTSLSALVVYFFWLVGARSIFKIMGVQEPILGYCMEYTLLILPMVLITGILAGSCSIFQAEGYTRPILIGGIIRSLLNIVLDWLLIFGHWGFPEMGLRGAALATTIAEFIGTLIILIQLFRSQRISFKLSWSRIWRAPLRIYRQLAAKGLPSAGEELLWNLGNLGILRLLNTISILAAGIHTIIFSVDILPALVFIALGQGVLTLTGHKTGEKDYATLFQPAYRGLRDSWLLALLVFLAFVLIPRLILRIFTSDISIIEQSVPLMVIAGINFFPRSVNIILGHAIRGYGDTRWMFRTQVLGTVQVIALSALFLFVFNWGIPGVFIAVLVDESIRSLLNFWRFRKGPDEMRAQDILKVAEKGKLTDSETPPKLI